jgi:hypothetical protein
MKSLPNTACARMVRLCIVFRRFLHFDGILLSHRGYNQCLSDGDIVAELELSLNTLGRRFEAYQAHF